MNKTLEPVFRCFGNDLYNCMNKLEANMNEVRIRSDKPVVVYIDGMPNLINRNGTFEPLRSFTYEKNYISVSRQSLRNSFGRLCEFSVYKHQNDINNGFITVRGGHRIGICGTAVISPTGIKSVTDITSLNIRAASQHIGCSESFFREVDPSGGVLICGIPSTGKTTLLRDISRTLSTNLCKKVSVIDERSEISSVVDGKNIFDLGLCDIYCGYPKEKAIIQAIRTMSPDFVICDELTGNDIESVILTVNYGVKLIATVHCENLSQALKNPSIMNLIRTRAFAKIVFLKDNTFCKINYCYNMEDIKID